MGEASELHPLFLRLDGRTVVVVGAGTVAERKIAALIRAGAFVRVVAPSATKSVAALASSSRIEWRARMFEDTDLDGAWLAFASTDDSSVQRAVAEAARARRVFLVAVDDIPNASAYSAATVQRAPFTIAISSGGEAPALSRLLREILESVLPEHEWVEAARALREKWRAERTPMESRFRELVRAFKLRAQ